MYTILIVTCKQFKCIYVISFFTMDISFSPRRPCSVISHLGKLVSNLYTMFSCSMAYQDLPRSNSAKIVNHSHLNIHFWVKLKLTCFRKAYRSHDYPPRLYSILRTLLITLVMIGKHSRKTIWHGFILFSIGWATRVKLMSGRCRDCSCSCWTRHAYWGRNLFEKKVLNVYYAIRKN